jgi:hypothetical protein
MDWCYTYDAIRKYLPLRTDRMPYHIVTKQRNMRGAVHNHNVSRESNMKESNGHVPIQVCILPVLHSKKCIPPNGKP